MDENRQPLSGLDRASAPLNALRAAGVALDFADAGELTVRLREAIVDGRLADGAKLPPPARSRPRSGSRATRSPTATPSWPASTW